MISMTVVYTLAPPAICTIVNWSFQILPLINNFSEWHRTTNQASVRLRYAANATKKNRSKTDVKAMFAFL